MKDVSGGIVKGRISATKIYIRSDGARRISRVIRSIRGICNRPKVCVNGRGRGGVWVGMGFEGVVEEVWLREEFQS